MLKQRPMVYLSLLAVFGALWFAGVSIDRLLPIGLLVPMLLMHMGGHGHGGHETLPPEQEPTADRPIAPTPQDTEGPNPDDLGGRGT